MMRRKGGYILTHTGRHFYVIDPRPEDVCIDDIAHGLARLCRFNGHVDIPGIYSVAQHSVYVSELLPPELRMWGLLHDAAEAYLGDMVHPLKVEMPSYKKAEDRVEACIAEHFGLTWPMPKAIKKADLIMLATEKRDLIRHDGDRDWGPLNGITPRLVPIENGWNARGRRNVVPADVRGAVMTGRYTPEDFYAFDDADDWSPAFERMLRRIDMDLGSDGRGRRKGATIELDARVY